MCTTACMQFAMALLCKQISLPLANASYHSVVQRIDECMNVGSIVHGRVETIMDRVHGKGGHMHAGRMHRMISVNELISMLNIDLKGLGVHKEELVVTEMDGGSTLLTEAGGTVQDSDRGHRRRHVESNEDGPNASASGNKCVRNRPRYQASSCFISLQQLPTCMEMVPTAQDTGSPMCVALATANGHTVCAASYGHGLFAFFDSLPGKYVVGLSGSDMLHHVQTSLSLAALQDNAPSSDSYACSPKRSRQSETRHTSRHSSPPKVSLCDITLLYMDH